MLLLLKMLWLIINDTFLATITRDHKWNYKFLTRTITFPDLKFQGITTKAEDRILHFKLGNSR